MAENACARNAGQRCGGVSRQCAGAFNKRPVAPCALPIQHQIAGVVPYLADSAVPRKCLHGTPTQPGEPAPEPSSPGD